MSIQNLKNIILVSGIIIIFLIAGCATVFKGTTENLSLNSEPEGVEIYINSNFMGKTPLPLKLETNKSYHIEFRMLGHESKIYTLNRRVGAGWLILDVFAGLIPVIVDAATGAWYSLDQNDIWVRMEDKPEVFLWRLELIKYINNPRYEDLKELWQYYAKRNNIKMTPNEWINQLNEEEYIQYKKSGQSHLNWLFLKFGKK